MILLLLLAGLVQAAPADGVGREKAWLNLLHYKDGRSNALGDLFFLAPNGRTDPQAELEADLRAFEVEGSSETSIEPRWSATQSAQCRFPARFHWLKKRLGLSIPDQTCSRFELWRTALDAQSATLIFADAFLNNPASMYGHTFLRLRRRGQAPGLLDYTVNYAGKPDTDNGIMYAVRGVFGLYPGGYSTTPYYMKVQEYTSLESRDLWEYDLNLSSETVAQLVRHAWELGSTQFPYYFFSENCSYQLLTLLDAADPSLNLAEGFGFATIPADTLRAVIRKPGMLAGVRYRPSHVREMLARRAALSPEELRQATRIGRRGSFEGASAAAIDSGYDYLRYREGFQDVPKPELAAYERSLLIARGKLGAPPSAVTPARPEPVESGHETARVGAGGGASTFGPWQELSFRPALRDLPSDPRGYAETSQLEMGNVRLRFDGKNRRPFIEQVRLLDIQSLSPWDPWVRKHSWRVSTGVEQAKELGRKPFDSMVYDLSGGLGLAAKPAWPLSPLGFVFAEAGFNAGPALSKGWRIGGGGTAGLMLRPVSWWRLLTTATWREFQQGPHQERLRLISSWTLARDWELRATLDRRRPDSEAGASLLFYF